MAGSLELFARRAIPVVERWKTEYKLIKNQADRAHDWRIATQAADVFTAGEDTFLKLLGAISESPEDDKLTDTEYRNAIAGHLSKELKLLDSQQRAEITPLTIFLRNPKNIKQSWVVAWEAGIQFWANALEDPSLTWLQTYAGLRRLTQIMDMCEWQQDPKNPYNQLAKS